MGLIRKLQNFKLQFGVQPWGFGGQRVSKNYGCHQISHISNAFSLWFRSQK